MMSLVLLTLLIGIAYRAGMAAFDVFHAVRLACWRLRFYGRHAR